MLCGVGVGVLPGVLNEFGGVDELTTAFVLKAEVDAACASGIVCVDRIAFS